MLNAIVWYGFVAAGLYAIWKLMRDD